MLTYAEAPAIYWELGTGALLVAVALAIGAAGSFRAKAAAFAVAEGSFGAFVILDSVVQLGVFGASLNTAMEGLEVVLLVLSAIGFGWLFELHARQGPAQGRIVAWRYAGILLGIGVVYHAVFLVWFGPPTPPGTHVLAITKRISWEMTSGWMITLAAASGFLHAAQPGRRRRRDLGVMAVALTIYPALAHMGGFFGAVSDLGRANALYTMSAILLAVALYLAPWIRSANRSGGRQARNVTLAMVGLLIAGVLWHAALPTNVSGPAAARILGLALLAYAVLGHQYLGLDVKLRWTLSKSTIAAIFVAVFFIVSEGVTQLFSDFTGSTYVGIAAAGALVFILAPLQRMADRLATTAIPISAAQAPDVYRHAVLAALRGDGQIGPDEEIHLVELAEKIGLGAADALRLRRELAASLPPP